jgi:hypothetical protein
MAPGAGLDSQLFHWPWDACRVKIYWMVGGDGIGNPLRAGLPTARFFIPTHNLILTNFKIIIRFQVLSCIVSISDTIYRLHSLTPFQVFDIVA